MMTCRSRAYELQELGTSRWTQVHCWWHNCKKPRQKRRYDLPQGASWWSIGQSRRRVCLGSQHGSSSCRRAWGWREPADSGSWPRVWSDGDRDLIRSPYELSSELEPSSWRLVRQSLTVWCDSRFWEVSWPGTCRSSARPASTQSTQLCPAGSFCRAFRHLWSSQVGTVVEACTCHHSFHLTSRQTSSWRRVERWCRSSWSQWSTW